jgi:hypothetical protein
VNSPIFLSFAKGIPAVAQNKLKLAINDPLPMLLNTDENLSEWSFLTFAKKNFQEQIKGKFKKTKVCRCLRSFYLSFILVERY